MPTHQQMGLKYLLEVNVYLIETIFNNRCSSLRCTNTVTINSDGDNDDGRTLPCKLQCCHLYVKTYVGLSLRPYYSSFSFYFISQSLSLSSFIIIYFRPMFLSASFYFNRVLFSKTTDIHVNASL